MQNDVNKEEMSLSKQRKLARMAEIAKQKKQKLIKKVVLAAAIVLILGLAAFFIVRAVINKQNEPSSQVEYSALLDDNGKIQNVKPLSYINLPDYSVIRANLAELEYSDEDVDSDIADELDSNRILDDSAEAVAAMGDTVNIDYEGSIDGVVFDGGTASDAELELGSKNFIDDFEDQIAGHKPGDEFNVEVTFPDPYQNNPDLAGKDAVFAVKLNGIYVLPEFNDEYVKENLSEYASTAEEYRKYLKDQKYEENLKEFVQKYIVENTTIKNNPSKYLAQLKKNMRNTDYVNYEYMNQFYLSYTGNIAYESFDAYIQDSYGKSLDEYNDSLEEMVSGDMKFTLACQAIAEAEGINASLDAAREKAYADGTSEEEFAEQLEAYGTGYVVQNYMCGQVVEKLCNNVHAE